MDPYRFWLAFRQGDGVYLRCSSEGSHASVRHARTFFAFDRPFRRLRRPESGGRRERRDGADVAVCGGHGAGARPAHHVVRVVLHEHAARQPDEHRQRVGRVRQHALRPELHDHQRRRQPDLRQQQRRHLHAERRLRRRHSRRPGVGVDWRQQRHLQQHRGHAHHPARRHGRLRGAALERPALQQRRRAPRHRRPYLQQRALRGPRRRRVHVADHRPVLLAGLYARDQLRLRRLHGRLQRRHPLLPELQGRHGVRPGARLGHLLGGERALQHRQRRRHGRLEAVGRLLRRRGRVP